MSKGQAEALMEGKPAFGNWATKDVIPDQTFARNDLAIMKEFKDDVSFKVTVESTAPHKVNQSVVGPMGDAKGGAGQVEFLGNKNLKVVGQPQALPVRAPVEVPKAPQVNGPVAKPHVAPEAPKAPEAKPQARPVVEPQRGAPAPLETKPSAPGAAPVNDGPGTVNAPAASKSVALGEKPPAYFTECFVAGTLVHTAEGGKRIEDIVVGDMVAARDEVNKTTTFKPVMQLFLVEGKEIVHVSVRTASGESDIISTTNEHPFFVHQDWWRGASDLKAGDRLELLEGGIVEVTGVRVDAELATTYNFEVADVHTYFVGKLGVWVHNTCSMKYADGAPTLSTPAAPTIARGPVTGPALPVRNAGLNTTSPAAAPLSSTSSAPLSPTGALSPPAPRIVDKSWKAKIDGIAQRTGQDARHQVRTYREAIKLAKDPNVVSVHLDHGYNRALGLDPKTISPNRRPDVVAIYNDKRVARVEVQSKTDIPAILRSRNSALDVQLRAKGYTPLAPVVILPTRNP